MIFYLEEERDFDTLINNMNNFYIWCASRVLSLDRKYAKEILNSIGMAQATTDRDRAKIFFIISLRVINGCVLGKRKRGRYLL